MFGTGCCYYINPFFSKPRFVQLCNSTLSCWFVYKRNTIFNKEYTTAFIYSYFTTIFYNITYPLVSICT